MISERLKKCVEAGSVVGLFPLLKDWSQDELRALLAEIEEYSEELNKAIDGKFGETLMNPAVFFFASNKQISEMKELTIQAKMEVVQILSEIASVAVYYLRDEDEA